MQKLFARFGRRGRADSSFETSAIFRSHFCLLSSYTPPSRGAPQLGNMAATDVANLKDLVARDLRRIRQRCR
ncbi:hypothetical protein WJX84_000923 [Apatococcus fuscideae]|uniref:Uncharacterized protein n=1 Tax=Apatococcus fuscideae TaxID=2026836 RepID=A0AAW1T6G0_9CHLO